MALFICGGKELSGHVTAQGAKNAVLPMLFASLLCREPVTLHGVPDIGDVSVTLSLLGQMGVRTERIGDTVTLDAKDAVPPTASLQSAAELRASSYLLGASLARFGEGEILLPGGCALGGRPLDLHKDAFLSLGAVWREEEGRIGVGAQTLHGARFSLSYPSVGATVNFLLAALGAEGESTLFGYAKEYHVMDFIAFLRTLGARIHADSRALSVEGGGLHGGEYTVTSDAMEAGTYLIAAAATGGDVTVSRVRSYELSPLLLAFRKMSVPFSVSGDAVRVRRCGQMRGIALTAAPYPAFPTDLHPQMAVLLSCTADGGSICDHVFSDRFAYIDELARMGFHATRSARTVRVSPSCLSAATVTAPDLRGGAALLTAALLCEGETVLREEGRIDRGYEHIERKLFSLGAHVRRATEYGEEGEEGDAP